MSLDKAIEHGKEHRKKYYGAKCFDRSCRNHGGCGYCKDNRTYADRRRRYYADKQVKDWKRYE